MAAAISFAEGGIVNQTRATVNALEACDCSRPSSPCVSVFLSLSVSRSLVCVCVRARLHTRRAHGVIKRKCCEENGEKRGARGCLHEVACVYKVARFKGV